MWFLLALALALFIIGWEMVAKGILGIVLLFVLLPVFFWLAFIVIGMVLASRQARRRRRWR